MTRVRFAKAAAGAVWLALCLASPPAPAQPGTAASDENAAAPEAIATAAEPAGDPAKAWAAAEEFAPAGTAPAEELEDPAAAIETAWLTPAPSLEDRVARTRRTSLELGVWSLDAAARAVLVGSFGSDPIERAVSAVRLAPDLPAARMELARGLWLHGDAPVDAVRVAAGALAAIPRHLEASLWFAGSLLYVLAGALVSGGLLWVVIAGLFAFPHAAHDLGDAVARSMPSFARVALVSSALLVPLALGEGVLGFALPFLVLAVAYGSRGQKVVLVATAAAVLAGAFPVARFAGAALEAFAGDPVAEAAYHTANGFAFPVDIARLEAAAETDPLAARALARGARRAGSLGTADAHYQGLLEVAPEDVVIANNAANVRLNLGHMESALALYEHAAELEPSAVVLFNLSQAHGRAFQVEDLADTLAMAQEADPVVVAELTQLQGAEMEGFVVDLPLPKSLLWRRVLASEEGAEIAAELRAPFAPGRLGSDPLAASGAFAAAIVAGALLGSRSRPSRLCSRCGARQCPRCDDRDPSDVCESCTRLFHQPESADRALRAARIEALRRRERWRSRLAALGCVLVPGSAGSIVGRPLRGLLGAVLFSLAAFLLIFREGVVPDPLVAGAAAPFFFIGAAFVALFFYTAVALMSLATFRSG